MSAAAPFIFDRLLGRRRLARALARGYPDFLLLRAAGELDDRLAVVTRIFACALDLGTPTDAAAALLRSRRSGTLVRLAPAAPAAPAAPVDAAGGDVVGDEEALPFRPGSFDLAVSLLALQGVNDLPGALVQIRRALSPDGLFLACLFGGETLKELRAAFTEAESEGEGGASPRVAPFADVKVLGSLLQRAGFALPVVDLDTVAVRYASPLALMADLRAMGLANNLAERSRRPLRRSTLGRALEIYAQRFSDPDGRVRATFDLVWLSGWAPHESQQRPLAPGSAKTRLADALGTRELDPIAPGGSS